MPTILGLDIGKVRIGAALSDESGKIAFPFEIFSRAKGEAERKIIELVSKRNVTTIIVGLPLDESGRRTSECQQVENFCRRLGKRLQVPILFVDEYYSTQDAMSKTSVDKVDAHAAAIILQEYLDKGSDCK